MAAITADLWPHPLTAEGRATRRIPVGEGSTLASLVDLVIPGAAAARVVAAAVDGCPIPQEEWVARVIRDGEIVTLRRSLEGGGGGNKALRTVLSIAVIVASFSFAPGLGTALAISTAAARTVILVGGSLLVSALLPPPEAEGFGEGPASPEIAGGRGYSSLTGQNATRPHQPLPLLLGRHRVIPDRITEVTPTIESGAQHATMVLSWGIGDLEIGPLSFGSTPFATLSDVTAVHSDAYPLQVIHRTEEVGIDMESVLTVSRQAHERATSAAIGIQTRLGYAGDDGVQQSRSVSILVTPVPGAAVTGTYGGNNYAVGLHEIEIGPLEPRTRVDVNRTAAATADARAADQARYLYLRSEEAGFTVDRTAGDTLTLIEALITEQLGAGLRAPIHAECGQRVPTWDAATGAWTTTRTVSSNPAAIFRAIGVGWRDSDGTGLIAGGGLAAEEIDDDELGEWYEWCAAHEPVLACNMVVASQMTVGRLLELVARTGRASPTWHTGRLGVVYEADREPSFAVTPGRIVAGSMETDWASGAIADEVVMRYIDPRRDWTVKEVRRLAPGVTVPERTSVIDGVGITSVEQASYLAGLQAASQAVHRRHMTWEMGRAALALGRGDVGLLAHDLVTGGTGGRVRSMSSTGVVLDRQGPVLDGPAFGAQVLLVGYPDGRHYLRELDGARSIPPRLEFVDALAADELPEPGVSAEDIVWRLYAEDETPLEVRVVSIEPLSEDRIRLTAIDESDAYSSEPAEVPGEICITESGDHVWSSDLSSAKIWLISGTGGTGGAGGTAGGDGWSYTACNPGDYSGPHPIVETGGFGATGGPGGLGGTHATGSEHAGHAPGGFVGGGGRDGQVSRTRRLVTPASGGHEGAESPAVYEHCATAEGGQGGGGGGGGAGGYGAPTAVAVGGVTHSSGAAAGGAGDRGNSNSGGGAGGSGGAGHTTSGGVGSFNGTRSVRIVTIDGLTPGTVLSFALGAGGGHGGHGARGGRGGNAAIYVGPSTPGAPGLPGSRPSSTAAAGYALILPS